MTVLFYVAPESVRNTAFLTHQHAQTGATASANRPDDQWLYLPALRKVRRIPGANRGDYFLGTDLTYEEIKQDNRVSLSDWTFKRLGKVVVDGVPCIAVEGLPMSAEVGDELGVSRVVWHIDAQARMSRRNDYWDANKNPLKTVHNAELRRFGQYWMATLVEVTNHKSGHRTVLRTDDVQFDATLATDLFGQQRLVRGL